MFDDLEITKGPKAKTIVKPVKEYISKFQIGVQIRPNHNDCVLAILDRNEPYATYPKEVLIEENTEIQIRDDLVRYQKNDDYAVLQATDKNGVTIELVRINVKEIESKLIGK